MNKNLRLPIGVGYWCIPDLLTHDDEVPKVSYGHPLTAQSKGETLSDSRPGLTERTLKI